MKVIRIDDDVWKILQQKAIPFEDTPNTVLRRILGLNGEPKPAVSNEGRKEEKMVTTSVKFGGFSRRPPSRAKTGTIFPQPGYREPILRVLMRMGGEGGVRDILAAVHELIKGDLKPLDYEDVPSGIEVRWKIQAMFQRKKMIEDGLLDSGAPKGVWRLSAEGWQAARGFEA
jgi:hypothetical protein